MNLFHLIHPEQTREELAPGATLLRGFALPNEAPILQAIRDISDQAQFRHMITPGGLRMSVAMTNCGAFGWVSDRKGYRYDPIDPENGEPWPPMPPLFQTLAINAAETAGFNAFAPDVCLINRYEPGTKLSLHQDRDEADYSQPIVSVSLGLPAVFLFGGDQRSGKTRRIALEHGDIVVWGGPARLRYHGILPLKDGQHPLTGKLRFNLTFRKSI